MLVEISILNYYNPKEIKLPIRLCLAFSHFLYHKFKREFQDTFSLFCSCDNDIELLANIAFTVPTVLKKEQLYWIKSKISMKTSWRKIANYLFERLFLVTVNFLNLAIWKSEIQQFIFWQLKCLFCRMTPRTKI